MEALLALNAAKTGLRSMTRERETASYFLKHPTNDTHTAEQEQYRTEVRSPRPGGKTMVQPDPMAQWYFLGRFIALFGVFLLVIAAGVWIVKGQNPTALVILAFIYLLAGAGFVRWGKRRLKIELLRQVAASGEEDARLLLATNQPQPDEAALALPCKIKLRPKWTPPILCFLGIAIVVFTVLTIFLLNTPPAPFGAYVAAYGVILLFPMLISSLFPLLAWQTMIVTTEGLRIQAERPLTIKWQDAQLFTIYPANKPSEPPIRYELSGPKAIVRWKRMPRGVSSLLTKTPDPFDEYDRQMEALLALITAKTGLPLYDLREE